MVYTNRITWENIRSVDSATLAGIYVPIGTPLLFPSYICKLVNTSTVLVTISIDGINDKDVAPANSFWLYDETKYAGEAMNPALPSGTQIMIKGAAGVGLIYLVSQYIVQS